MGPEYELDELDTEDTMVETAYLLEWEETDHDELADYLVQNSFESLDGEEPTQFVYHGEDGRMARAWLDERNGRAALKVTKDIYEEAEADYEDGEVPMALQGVMMHHDAVSLEEYLEPGPDVDVVDEEAVEELQAMDYDTPGGVSTNGSPRM
jgi:hypothetical protein